MKNCAIITFDSDGYPVYEDDARMVFKAVMRERELRKEDHLEDRTCRKWQDGKYYIFENRKEKSKCSSN